MFSVFKSLSTTELTSEMFKAGPIDEMAWAELATTPAQGVGSVVECGAICLKHSCDIFSFDKTTKTCQYGKVVNFLNTRSILKFYMAIFKLPDGSGHYFWS